jgi:hypothetical protein
MALERRLLVLLRGAVDRARLEELRRSLGLRPRGRLTDQEDSEFGYRYVGDPDDRSVILSLWRYADDEWGVALDTVPPAGVADPDVEMWAARAEEAAAQAGLAVVERRVFGQSRQRPQSRVANEDWLRAMSWDLPASTLAELWPVLGLSPSAPEHAKRDALRRFMAEQVWRAAPDRVRAEADAFLRFTQ